MKMYTESQRTNREVNTGTHKLYNDTGAQIAFQGVSLKCGHAQEKSGPCLDGKDHLED